MAPIKAIDIKRRAIKAGATLPPTVVPANLLAGATTATLTLTVDDPTADPPTDAKVMLTIEASDDGGQTWYVVSSSWGGTSGVLVSVVPVRGRRLRLSGRADQAVTIDAAVEVA